MKKDAYEADVQVLSTQNKNLWLAVAGLILLLILALMLVWSSMGSSRTVVTPPNIEKSFWITNGTASDTYLTQMAQWVSFLSLDVTPDNVAYKSDLLLKLAHPDYHGALQQKLRINAEKIRRDNASTSFDVRVAKAAPDALAAILTGYLKVTINGTVVKNELRHYLARFSIVGGQAQLIKFRRVKIDDFKAVLAETETDDENELEQ
ncbi:type IV conjugative transfer system protein TraE [Parasulfuritortus cantonensis]|uniref:Type IV conjugative transfer system protein TraE n=1 Tax=Parasulfuritortus cantonensis TaxID=2528202 RepID=A0A4R1BSA0_9PROT|nr:type IV conjugative transfer system protein TraE [Parasulfuritortus cantonensis]TCJ20176.1 type IV conjugative transfer system protein TraE [Parasulfuritortus cantonensis]